MENLTSPRPKRELKMVFQKKENKNGGIIKIQYIRRLEKIRENGKGEGWI